MIKDLIQNAIGGIMCVRKDTMMEPESKIRYVHLRVNTKKNIPRTCGLYICVKKECGVEVTTSKR